MDISEQLRRIKIHAQSAQEDMNVIAAGRHSPADIEAARKRLAGILEQVQSIEAAIGVDED